VLHELSWVTANFSIPSFVFNSGFVVAATLIEQALGWTYDTASVTFPPLAARFVNESVLNGLVSSCEKMGLMFRLDPGGAKRVVFRSSPEVSGILATNLGDPLLREDVSHICTITNIQRQTDSWSIYNRVKVFGAGDGEARLTMAAATLWPNGFPITTDYIVTDLSGVLHNFVLDKATNTIRDTASIAAYGERQASIAIKDIAPVTSNDADMIAAANALVMSAVNKLLALSVPQEQYQLAVTGLQQELLPGQKLHVEARRWADGQPLIEIDKDLLVLETETQIDTNSVRIVGLTVSTSKEFAKTDADILSERIQELRAFEAHPQTGPIENTLTYRDEVDFDHPATFPFWMSRGAVVVNSVILRFQVEALRSSVKAQGGTVTGTVTIPGHSHPVTLPSHDHDLAVLGDNDPSGNHPLARLVLFEPFEGNFYFQAAAGGSFATSTEGGGDGTVGSGGGGNATVDLDLSSAISTKYGVYEDAASATYGVDALAWTANSAPVVESPTAILGGWYELDITDYLTNAAVANRPIQYNNSVGVRVLAKEYLPGQDEIPEAQREEKRVRVTAQIELRTTIQSIAVI
jgi:hypothetical protein